MPKLSKYERKNRKIKKYVKTYVYDKICEIKYKSFNWKLLETNLWLAKINLSRREEKYVFAYKSESWLSIITVSHRIHSQIINFHPRAPIVFFLFIYFLI